MSAIKRFVLTLNQQADCHLAGLHDSDALVCQAFDEWRRSIPPDMPILAIRTGKHQGFALAWFPFIEVLHG